MITTESQGGFVPFDYDHYGMEMNSTIIDRVEQLKSEVTKYIHERVEHKLEYLDKIQYENIQMIQFLNWYLIELSIFKRFIYSLNKKLLLRKYEEWRNKRKYSNIRDSKSQWIYNKLVK